MKLVGTCGHNNININKGKYLDIAYHHIGNCSKTEVKCLKYSVKI